MHVDDNVDLALMKLGAITDRTVPEDFMDGVWMRAGRHEEVSARNTRLALLAAVALIGMGSGFEATIAPAQAEPTHYRLIDGADLSPASLLHVEP